MVGFHPGVFAQLVLALVFKTSGGCEQRPQWVRFPYTPVGKCSLVRKEPQEIAKCPAVLGFLVIPSLRYSYLRLSAASVFAPPDSADHVFAVLKATWPIVPLSCQQGDSVGMVLADISWFVRVGFDFQPLDRLAEACERLPSPALCDSC